MNQRQELFCLGLFKGKSIKAAAIEAGYSVKNAESIGSRMSRNIKVLGRLEELRKRATDTSIVTVIERKQRLSEIIKARYPDFVECGADGSWVNIGPESPNAGAVSEIHTRTEYDKDGSKPTVYTSVKLHDPVKAIAELNKMEGAYAPIRQEITGKDGGPIKQEQTINWANVPDVELEAAVKEVERLLLK